MYFTLYAVPLCFVYDVGEEWRSFSSNAMQQHFPFVFNLSCILRPPDRSSLVEFNVD